MTGVYRAVKVIWREDYDLASIFERELEGIKRFEPISRRSEGLVDILQVGLHDDEGFYYYVMELADDVEQGRDIDPETYVAHTYSSEMASRESIDLEACLRDGATLAGGLAHMHKHGLIHRDVKPSNVIFVEGEAKLADIGLVAMSGTRSFVGTEGFVPPEGPGTPAADIYSLGMVLYEVGTGKDRLDFPDVPTSLGEDPGRVLWTQLNKSICKACSANAKDRYETAEDMAQALRGQTVPGPARWLPLAAAALGMISLVGVLFASRGPGIEDGDPFELALNDTVTDFEILTDPPGAEVYEGAERLGVTPVYVSKPTGSRVEFTLRLEGFRNERIAHLVGDDRGGPLFYELEPWIQPQPGERWTNSLGLEFAPRTGGHVAVYPTDADSFFQFLETTGRPFEGEVMPHLFEGEETERFIVIVPYYDAEAFRSWLTEQDRAEGFLSIEDSYRLERFVESADPSGESSRNFEDDTEGEMAFRLIAERQSYGSVFINSSPPSAVVLLKTVEVGRTPIEIPRVKTGNVEFQLRADGYEQVMVEGEVISNELLEFQVDMEETRAVVFGRDWRNSLAMQFVPVGDVLISRWETRRRDFDSFTKESGTTSKSTVGWNQSQNQPVVEVSRDEAEAFCKWLTNYERRRGTIEEYHEYRLPTDLEWSRAVGLPTERGLDPASRAGRIRGVYPWGFSWPPPNKSGNFADQSAQSRLKDKIIKGYSDGVRYTAQVSDLEPNEKGIFHLGGNVWEWVAEDFGGGGKQGDLGVVRGGSWQSADPEELLSSYRKPLSPQSKIDSVGVRCVLARVDEDDAFDRD